MVGCSAEGARATEESSLIETVVLRDGDHTRADDVGGIGLIAGLFSLDRSDLPCSGPTALPLEVAAPVCIDPPLLLNGRTRVDSTIRIDREIDDPQVDSQIVLGLATGRFGRVKRAVQEERAVTVDEIGLTPEPSHPSGLVLPEADRHDDSPDERQQADGLNPLPRHDPLIVGDRPVWAEAGLHGLVPLAPLHRRQQDGVVLGGGRDAGALGMPRSAKATGFLPNLL